MNRPVPPEVGDRIRALLRERDYSSAAAYAEMALDSLGIEEPAPTPPKSVGPAVKTEGGGAETVGGRIARIFDDGKEGP